MIHKINYKLLYGLTLMPSIFQIKKWWSKNVWHKKFNDNSSLSNLFHPYCTLCTINIPISCIFKYNVFSF